MRTHGCLLLLVTLALGASACDVERLPMPAGQIFVDTAVELVDQDGDGFNSAEDCDDLDPEANPAFLERCDGTDNDCDGETDETTAADAPIWYADADGDGYGDPGVATIACDTPTGSVSDSSDCDDSDGTTNPGGVESGTLDEVDSDCDGNDEVIYDAAADFSATENPNDTWIYGHCEFGTCEVSPLAATSNLDLAGMAFWLYDASDSTSLKVGLNTTGSEIVGPVVYPPNGLILHPGTGPPVAVVQWTAPRAGTCLVYAEFTSLDDVTSGVSVWHKTTGSGPIALLDDQFLATTECDGDEITIRSVVGWAVDVAPEDTIDARVSWGCDGSVATDTVGLTMSLACMFPL